MQQTHAAVKHTAGYHPLPEPHHGAGDVFGLLLVIVLGLAFVTLPFVVAWRLMRWLWRVTR